MEKQHLAQGKETGLAVRRSTHLLDRLRRLSVFLPLSLVVALGLAALIGILRFGTSAIDELARANMRERVQVALTVEQQRLADLLYEYTYWDDAYRNLVANLDTTWAMDNIGVYLNEEADIDLALVIDGLDRPLITFIDGEQVPFVRVFPNAGILDEVITSARKDMRRPAPEIRYLAIGRDAYLLALDSFVPEHAELRAADGSVMAFARRIDGERIARIGELYRIPGLSIADRPERLPDALKTDLLDGAGAPILTLTWADQTPANDIRKDMRPYVAALGIVMTALIFWVFYLEIRNHRERESLLREMASVDHLTGISNRREFFVMADKVLSIARRANTPVSLLLLDVDNFKQVNDTLGHTRGDRILTMVAAQLREELRQSDVYARYGGDEFVIMLPGTDAQNACTLAERLRADIAKLAREYARGRFDCTVSIGVAEYRSGESVERLISRADDALYQAKYAGRNRVVRSDDKRLLFPDTTPSGGGGNTA